MINLFFLKIIRIFNYMIKWQKICIKMSIWIFCMFLMQNFIFNLDLFGAISKNPDFAHFFVMIHRFECSLR